MKPVIAVFMAALMIFAPIVAYADPTPKVAPLVKGQRAPFNGVLMNSAASAKIKIEQERSKALCKLEVNYLKMRSSTDCKLKVDLLKTELEGLRKKNLEINRIKDEELVSLRKIAAKNNSGRVGWWIALGAGVGVVLTIASFVLVAQVRKSAE